MARFTNGVLDFDEFSAWFLKQEGLPDDLTHKKGHAASGLDRKKRKKSKAKKALGVTFTSDLLCVSILL